MQRAREGAERKIGRIAGRRHAPTCTLSPLANKAKMRSSHGVVAQLGERRVRNAEVGSSILLHSTKILTNCSRQFLLVRA